MVKMSLEKNLLKKSQWISDLLVVDLLDLFETDTIDNSFTILSQLELDSSFNLETATQNWGYAYIRV